MAQNCLGSSPVNTSKKEFLVSTVQDLRDAGKNRFLVKKRGAYWFIWAQNWFAKQLVGPVDSGQQLSLMLQIKQFLIRIFAESGVAAKNIITGCMS